MLIESPLSNDFKRDGIKVEVHIYRGDDDTALVLEVVEDANNSYVWNWRLITDEPAIGEFLASIEKGGMKQFNLDYRSRLH